MGIDGVLMVLVELEQAAGVSYCRDDLFEHAEFMEAPKDFAESSWGAHESEESSDGFITDGFIDSRQHPFTNGAPGFVFDATLELVRELHQFEHHAGIVLDSFQSSRGCPNFFESESQIFARSKAQEAVEESEGGEFEIGRAHV